MWNYEEIKVHVVTIQLDINLYGWTSEYLVTTTYCIGTCLKKISFVVTSIVLAYMLMNEFLKEFWFC